MASSSYLSDNRDNTQKLQKYHDFPAKVRQYCHQFLDYIFLSLSANNSRFASWQRHKKHDPITPYNIYIGTIKIKSNSLTHNHLLN